MVGGLRRRLAGRRGLHGLGLRELLRRPRGRRQGGQAAADVRQRLARSPARSAAGRGLSERRPRRAGDRRLEGRGAVPRPRRARHLRRRRRNRCSRDYDRPDNPLFVPESRFAVGRMFWALGHHRALGFSVFGVDHARPDGQLARACALLGEMEDVVTAAQAEGRIAGVLLDDGETEHGSPSAATTSSPATRAPCSAGCCSMPVSANRHLHRRDPARPRAVRTGRRRPTRGRSAS